jgi:hypothetical protein
MKKLLISTALVIAFFSFISTGNAIVSPFNTFYFETPVGSTMDGLPVDVGVTFGTFADSVTITIQNLQANPTSVIQNLSDLGFAFTGLNAPTSGTISSSSGVERIVAGDGTFTSGNTVDTGWYLTSDVIFPFGTGLELYVLDTAVGPAHTIIGPAGPGDLYSNANGSIAGNDPHNPFLYGATFTLSVPGIVGSTGIAGVEWSFGTTAGNIIQTPEPTTLLLLGSGMLVLAFARRYRKR